MQVVMRYSRQILPNEGTLTTLLTTRGGCIVAGTSTGAIALLAPDARRTVTPRLNLSLIHISEPTRPY